MPLPGGTRSGFYLRWPQSTLSLLCTNGAEKRTNGAEKSTNGAEKRTNGVEKRKCTLGPPYLPAPTLSREFPASFLPTLGNCLLMMRQKLSYL